MCWQTEIADQNRCVCAKERQEQEPHQTTLTNRTQTINTQMDPPQALKHKNNNIQTDSSPARRSQRA